jgi:hypothetical protein
MIPGAAAGMERSHWRDGTFTCYRLAAIPSRRVATASPAICSLLAPLVRLHSGTRFSPPEEIRHQQPQIMCGIGFAAGDAVGEQIVPELGIFLAHFAAASSDDRRQVLVDVHVLLVLADQAGDMHFHRGRKSLRERGLLRKVPDRAGDARIECLNPLIEDFLDDLVFRPEMVVEAARLHIDQCRHSPHRAGIVALTHDDVRRGVENLGPHRLRLGHIHHIGPTRPLSVTRSHPGSARPRHPRRPAPSESIMHPSGSA